MTGSSLELGSHEQTEEHRLERIKEGATMALYVAICLLAALMVASEQQLSHQTMVLTGIWGLTLGLALAHWFAFRLSSRLVAAGTVRRADAELAVAQLAGAAVVAALASVPVIVFDGEAALWVMAGFIALVGAFVARSGGASKLRATIYAGTTTVVALAIVVIKNVLAGH